MLSPCPFSSQHLLSSTHHLVLSLCFSLIREVKMYLEACGDNVLIHPQLRTRRKRARGGHLERLKKETDQHLSLVPARRAEETSREECSLHNHPSGRSPS
ncbi:hypothetical protein ACFX16_014506 [Malus domestica]